MRLILAAGAERPAVEPEFRKWLEAWDRGQPEELKKFREWASSRFEMNLIDEHEALRQETMKPVYGVPEERRRMLAVEWGLPII